MRKAKPKKRIILPDPKFGDVSVTKFVNHLMFDGKKNTSYRIFYTALEIVGAKMQKEEKTAFLDKLAEFIDVRDVQYVIFNDISLFYGNLESGSNLGPQEMYIEK